MESSKRAIALTGKFDDFADTFIDHNRLVQLLKIVPFIKQCGSLAKCYGT